MKRINDTDDIDTLDGAAVTDQAPEPEDEDECQRPAARTTKQRSKPSGAARSGAYRSRRCRTKA